MTRFCREPKSVTSPVEQTRPQQDPEELARQRKKFDDEMAAFQEMLNYNADVAYGINHNEES